MGRPYGSRTILIICGALAILLGALAAVQYRWSARVAAADAQREKEHLQAAATLFSQEFNTVAAQAVTFLQNDGAAAVKSGSPLTGVPKLLGDDHGAGNDDLDGGFQEPLQVVPFPNTVIREPGRPHLAQQICLDLVEGH